MPNVLSGTLEGTNIASVLQFLAADRLTGCLRVDGPRRQLGQVYLHGGQIHHAASGEQHGLEALTAMFSWQTGRFTWHSGLNAPKRTLDTTLEALLLEASHRADLQDQTTPIHTWSVLTLNASHQSGGQHVRLNASSLRLLPALDGQRTLHDIATKLHMPLEDVLSAAHDLLDQSIAAIGPPAPLVTDAFFPDLHAALKHAIGPIAEVVIRDALDDLDLHQQRVTASDAERLLFEIITTTRDPQQRQNLEHEFQHLRQHHLRTNHAPSLRPGFLEVLRHELLRHFGPLTAVLLEDLLHQHGLHDTTLTPQEARSLLGLFERELPAGERPTMQRLATTLLEHHTLKGSR